MPEETATFALKVDADAEPAKEATAALEAFRSAIQKSQENLASYRKSMSLLKGSSDEVTDAKAKLKAAIAAEQAAITKNNLGILKLGGSYEKLQKNQKKGTDAFAAGRKAIAATGGPLKGISDHFEMLKGVLAGVTSGWGLLAVAVVASVAVVAAATAAVASLVGKFTEWVVTSADALRNMQLMREAASGNAKNATAWGHQIDWLSLKVSTSKDKLNELAVATEKSLRGTRVSGQGMVDIWSAVAQAGSAMGDDVGQALKSILERGKMTGRLGIDFKAPGISELQGTGITFQQVAAQLAKDLNVGLDQASAALVSHRVTMDAGAKAIREVVEKQLGDVNAKKMLSLGTIFTKLQDNLRDWTGDLVKEGGALEPLLKALKALVDMTGLQSEGGQKLKKVIGEYAAALANGITKNLPMLKQMVAVGLDIAAWLIRATGAVIQFATSSTGLFIIKTVLAAIGVAVALLAIALTPLAITLGIVVAGFLAVGAAIVGIYEGIKWLAGLDWATIGKNIIEGIKSGILSAWEGLKKAITEIGEGVKNAFKSLLGIHSPSRVFAQYGRQTGAGYAEGLSSSRRETEAATVEMVSVPRAPDGPSPGSASSPSSSASVSQTITPTAKVEFNFHGIGADKAAQVLQQSSVLDAVTHAIQTALRAAAVPTGLAPAAGG